ncbi:serine/threonine-protein kinase Sgk2 [Xylaria palmicola]|nr:serine/threonine-protein kinase Sgk2 [Xylaria palmicola]
MAQLTKEEHDVIQQNPLGDSLDVIRDALRDAEPDPFGETPQSDDSAAIPRPGRPRLWIAAVGKLLSIFSASDVSFVLASRTGSGTLYTDLGVVRSRFQKADFEHRYFRPLLRLVSEIAPDIDIWTAVIDLVSETLNSTPPTSLPSSFETPITHSSASLQGSDQTRPKVEARVFHEIRHCTYRAVEGFHEKYFGGRGWSAKATQIWERAKHLYSNKRWTQCPDVAVEDDMCRWWFGMQSKLLADQRAAYYRSTLHNTVGPDAPRQIDLVVKRRKDTAADEKHDWADLLVVSELKASDRKSKSLWLQLGSAVRNVFAAQPTRLFVHAFTLTGTEMETWVFDRSGPYSGATFDIHEKPEKFIQVMCGYLMMSDEELGLDTFIEERDNGLFVAVPVEGRGTKRKREFELDPKPMSYQRAIVCRGTSCFLAKAKGTSGYDRVVKYSWTSSMRPPEADLLRKANERGVKGLANLVGYQEEITSISKLRKDLIFPRPYRFRGIPSNTNNSSWSQSQSSRPISQSTSHGNANGRQGKRSSTDALSYLSKRSQRGNQVEEADHRDPENNGVAYTVQEPQGTSLALRDDHRMAYDDRILRVLVVSPAGRSIRQFQSGTELLHGLRDAITVHQSLYLDGRILHRDISENNIIITDPTKADGFRGMLIDLDLAKEEGQGASGARHRTGTMEFMAIEVLTGTSHTYRHDLEAFFYVLIWLCARRGWNKPPKKTMLARWYTGNYDEIAQSKRGDMDAGGLEVILREFPEKFDFVKPLCREIRDILFPYKRGLFTGTPQNPNVLYSPIIKAFDETLAKMESESLSTQGVSH